MDIGSRLSISFYKTIAVINEGHQIFVVQHLQTGKIYIKKILTVYNKNIYQFLQSHPVPHTPKIYEIYEENAQLTIIEEYVSGDTLEQLLENHVRFNTEDIIDIMISLCTIVSRLHHCHPAIIHRDIKPSNIILTPSGELYLLDFNAAKYYSINKLEDTELLGTKGYAAPEQYGFGVSSVQTDIYAIGMLLNTLVTGSLTPAVKSSSRFSSIIAKCTRLQACDRYKDVDAILRLFQNMASKSHTHRLNLPRWACYLPPGFQRLSPVPMLFAFAGYLFVFWLSLTLEVKNTTPVSLWINRIFCLLMFLGIIFCSFNYRNIQSSFPPCRTNHKLLKILSVLLLDALVFISFMIIMVIVTAIVTP